MTRVELFVAIFVRNIGINESTFTSNRVEVA